MKPDADLRPAPRAWPPELECDAIHSDHDGTTDNPPQAEAITVASVWQMASPEVADAALAGDDGAFAYRRDGHPNERSLASKLAQLHGATKAQITAQGMSAIAAVMLALLKPNSRVWIGNELYGKSTKLFNHDLAGWDIDTREFDPCDPEQLEQLEQDNLDVVLIETLSNPTIRVPDISRVNRAAKNAGATLVVDNTFATHLICRPLELGADLIVESLSKQVNGHSDSMLGLIASCDSELMQRIGDTISTFGMASSPLDCFLTHRGLQTLAVRLERACENGLALAQHLEKLDCVSQVHYVGLDKHPQRALAVRQFYGGFGWMLSFQVDAERERVLKLMQTLQPLFPFVPSLGDVATTISHPASTSHRGLSTDQRKELGISEGTLRVSCGIEPTEWLVEQFCELVVKGMALLSP